MWAHITPRQADTCSTQLGSQLCCMKENQKWARWNKLFKSDSIFWPFCQLHASSRVRKNSASRETSFPSRQLIVIHLKTRGCSITYFYLLLLQLSTRDEGISGNTSFTFLITLDKDLGELMLLKLSWEASDLWKSVWNRVQVMFPWAGQESKPLLTLGKISVKAGETQQRYSYSLQLGSHLWTVNTFLRYNLHVLSSVWLDSGKIHTFPNAEKVFFIKKMLKLGKYTEQNCSFIGTGENKLLRCSEQHSGQPVQHLDVLYPTLTEVFFTP